MATIQKSDVIGAITVYLINMNRPCPAHYLIQKFGDDVADIISSMKKDGVIVGRRGRNGGIVLPDTVFREKNNGKIIIPNNTFKPIEGVDDVIDNSDTDQLDNMPF